MIEIVHIPGTLFFFLLYNHKLKNVLNQSRDKESEIQAIHT